MAPTFVTGRIQDNQHVFMDNALQQSQVGDSDRPPRLDAACGDEACCSQAVPNREQVTPTKRSRSSGAGAPDAEAACPSPPPPLRPSAPANSPAARGGGNANPAQLRTPAEVPRPPTSLFNASPVLPEPPAGPVPCAAGVAPAEPRRFSGANVASGAGGPRPTLQQVEDAVRDSLRSGGDPSTTVAGASASARSGASGDGGRFARWREFLFEGKHLKPVRCEMPPAPAPNDAVLQNGGLRVSFPSQYPDGPQPPQREVMEAVAEALLGRKNAFVEAPTGTGKSLALICTALAHQSQRAAERAQAPDRPVPRVIFVSRTHDQLNNIVRELKKTKAREPISSLVPTPADLLRPLLIPLLTLRCSAHPPPQQSTVPPADDDPRVAGPLLRPREGREHGGRRAVRSSIARVCFKRTAVAPPRTSCRAPL